MKKILIYLNSMQPAGGIERVVSTLANELCIKHNVTILVKDCPNSFYEINKKISVKSIGTYRKLNMNSRFERAVSLFFSLIFSVVKLRSFFKKNDYDYVYVTTPISFLECLFTLKVSNKLIASEHGARNNYNIVYKLIKKTYKLAAAYVIPTIDDYNYYTSKHYPAIYIPHLRPSFIYKKSSSLQKKVLNIGRFTSDKKQLVLLNIWAEILIANPQFSDWELILVGQGELAHEISSTILDLGISNNVRILPPQKNIEDIYSVSSIFALTSSSEGFGMVLLEAISFGLATISFDCPSGPKDIIEDGKDGFLIKNNHNSEYKHKLIDLMRNDCLRVNMSDYGFAKGQVWNDSRILSKWDRLL